MRQMWTKQEIKNISLDKLIETYPTVAGTYQLKVTVSGGVVTYTWESVE